MFTEDLSSLKIGDDVFSILDGRGKVADILSADYNYPYVIRFHKPGKESYLLCFSKDGKKNTCDVNQCLFTHEVFIVSYGNISDLNNS